MDEGSPAAVQLSGRADTHHQMDQRQVWVQLSALKRLFHEFLKYEK